MNTDIRLSIGFWQHPKTRKTAKRLGLEGVRSLQILWLWAAINRPDGILSGMDWEDRECSRFPTLSHIMALLPRCRSAEHCGAPELPEYTTANNGPNRAALRGDADARAALDALVRRAAGRCAA